MGGRDAATGRASEGDEVKEAVVDANVLLRHLTGEPADLAARAGQVLAAAEQQHVRFILTALTLAEVVWVLQRTYRWSRPAIADGLTQLLRARAFDVLEATVLERAIQWYRARPRLHFADAYIAAVAAERGAAMVTFDREIRRLREIAVIGGPDAFEEA